MTLDEGIALAKNYIDETLMPARRTIGDWIKAEAITKPYLREIGPNGGVKNLFGDELPFEIAVIAYLRKIEKIPLLEIATAKELYEGIPVAKALNKTTAKMPANKIIQNIRYWAHYYRKIKNGYKLDEPSRVTGGWKALGPRVYGKCKLAI